MKFKLYLFLFFVFLNVSANEYFIPHVAESQWKTNLTIYNTNDNTVFFDIYSFDEYGLGPSINSYVVKPNGLLKINIGTVGIRKVITKNNEQLKVKLSYQFGDSKSLCEFFIPENIESKKYMLPNPKYEHIDWFGMAIANFKDIPLVVTITAIKKGEIVKEVEYNIPSYNKLVNISENILSGLSYDDFDMLLISSDTYFTAPLSICGNNSQDRHVFFLGEAVNSSNENKLNNFYIPHIVGKSWRTVISLYNPTQNEKNVNILFSKVDNDKFNNDITILPLSVKKLVSGIDFKDVSFAKLAAEDGIKVTVSYQMGDKPSVCELFVNGELGTEWIIPNNKEDCFSWTGVAITNFNDFNLSYSIDFYKGDSLVKTVSKNLEPNSKFVGLIKDIFFSYNLTRKNIDSLIIRSNKKMAAPLGIIGNNQQDRHTFYMGKIITPFNGNYKVNVKLGEGVEGYPSNGITEFEENALLSYSFNLKKGYKNINVLINGEKVSQSGSVIVDRNLNIEVDALDRETFKISVLQNENGNIYPLNNVFLKTNENKMFKIIPNDGYHVENVIVDGRIIGNFRKYTFESISENHTIEATFAKNNPKSIVNITDPVFKKILLKNFDLNNDGEITVSEAESVDGTIDTRQTGLITDLTGIEYFTNLKTLYCFGEKLDYLDLASNKKLYFLNCANNSLKELDVSFNKELYALECQNNKLTSLQLNNNKLFGLWCFSNLLEELDISSCSDLVNFRCEKNKIKTLDVSKNTRLTHLDCFMNKLTNIKFGNNFNLEDITCFNNLLREIDVSKLSKLGSINCESNLINRISIKNNKNLHSLWCKDNNLYEINIPENSILEVIDVSNNNLKNIDFPLKNRIGGVYLNGNSIEEIDLSNLYNLEIFCCSNNKLTELDLSTNHLLKKLDCSFNNLGDLNVLNNIMLESFYANGNNLKILDLSECHNLEIIECNENDINEININSNFIKLIKIENNNLESIAFAKQFPILEYLFCEYNLLSNNDCDDIKEISNMGLYGLEYFHQKNNVFMDCQ